MKIDNLKIDKCFLQVGRIEGISLLLLLFVAMPVKYMLGEPLLVKYVGMAHGLLFIGYSMLAYYMADRDKWGNRLLVICFVLSCLPGGTFLFEKHYLPKLQ